MPAKYNADGTGRDTYIRRDPVECFGKALYKSEPRLITRFGAAGSALPRDLQTRTQNGGVPDPVGGYNGGAAAFDRPARFLRPKIYEYPVEITHYSSMNQVVQNAYIAHAPQQTPGHLNHVSGYTGFKPRCPPVATEGSVEWATVCLPRTVRLDRSTAHVPNCFPRTLAHVCGLVATTGFARCRCRGHVN